MKAEQYKIIALDVDGTLVDHQGKLNPLDRDALIRVQKEKGVRLIIATGRPYAAMKHLGEELELDKYNGYLMPYNGGEAYSSRTGERLWQKAFPIKYVPKLYELSKAKDLTILTYTKEFVLTENVDDPYLAKELQITQMPTQKLNNFVEEIPSDISKCLVVGSAEDIEALEQDVLSALGDCIGAFRSDPTFLELVPKGINKALSIERLLKDLNFSAENLMAFGDSYNDLEMLEFASLGVAMGNAREEIKARANAVTLSNEEAGIASFINKLFFAEN